MNFPTLSLLLFKPTKSRGRLRPPQPTPRAVPVKPSNKMYLISFLGGLDDSLILASDTSKMSQLNTWLLPHLQSSGRSYWALCWRASAHGWSSQTFHSYCDDKGPTVTIVSVHESHGTYIFGGYNDNSWKCMLLLLLLLLILLLSLLS